MMNKTAVFQSTSSYLLIYMAYIIIWVPITRWKYFYQQAPTFSYIWLISLYWSLLQDGSISINKLLPSHIYGLYHYTAPYYKMEVFLSTSSYLLIYMAYIIILIPITRWKYFYQQAPTFSYIWLIGLYWSLLQDNSISINKLLSSHTYRL